MSQFNEVNMNKDMKEIKKYQEDTLVKEVCRKKDAKSWNALLDFWRKKRDFMLGLWPLKDKNE